MDFKEANHKIYLLEGERKVWEKQEIQRDWQIYGLGIWAASFIEPVKQNSTLEQKLYHSTY